MGLWVREFISEFISESVHHYLNWWVGCLGVNKIISKSISDCVDESVRTFTFTRITNYFNIESNACVSELMHEFIIYSSEATTECISNYMSQFNFVFYICFIYILWIINRSIYNMYINRSIYNMYINRSIYNMYINRKVVFKTLKACIILYHNIISLYYIIILYHYIISLYYIITLYYIIWVYILHKIL